MNGGSGQALKPLRRLDGGGGSVTVCTRCEHAWESRNLFCPECGAAKKDELATVKLAGFVGVQHTTSPAVEQFWQTGDPASLSKPGDIDYRPGFSLG